MVPRVASMPPQQLHQQRVTKPIKGIENFHSSKSYIMDHLAKQLATSAVVGDDMKTPSIVTNGSEEKRIDYTDLVKRKYFEQHENNEKDYTDQGIPSKIFSSDSFAPASDQSSLLSVGDGVGTRLLNTNENENKTNMLGGEEHRNRMKPCRLHTPPLTLYANEDVPPLSPHNSRNNPATDEIAGYLSPGPGMEILDSVEEHNIVNYSQAATIPPPLNLPSEDIAHVGSQTSIDSSRGSMSTAPHSLIKQPVLYSAIGSLEHANINSLTNLNKRFMTPSKEFCKPGKVPGVVRSILIPPTRNFQVKQKQQQNTTNSSSTLQGTIPSTARGTDLKKNQQKDRDADQHKISKHTKNQDFDEIKQQNTENKNPSIPSSISADKTNQRERSDRSHPADTNFPSHDNKEKTTNAKANNQKSTRGNQNSKSRKTKLTRKVSQDPNGKTRKSKSKKIEIFRPSSDAYTPRIERKKIKYKTAESRPSVQQITSPMGTLQSPNFRDALRRVAMIIHQHIVKIESRFEHQGIEYSSSTARTKKATNDGLFHASMRDVFNEDSYRTPTYKCNMARIPMARPGMVYGLRKVNVRYTIPTETEIYDFGHQLFKSVQLSPECSIICLIYVERLMEVAKVPLLACTWRPIFLCGLLLASKVWQDLSSWNIEFSSVYPQYSLDSINKLELNFLRTVKWDLYISSSCYAKYYFALRSLVAKQDFRQRYNRMVGGVGNVAQEEALKVQERTELVKEEAMLQLSHSMIW